MEKDKYIRIIYRGECVDSDDPLRLGRIRAYPKTENITNIESSNDYTPWGYDDPFLYLPLIPFFLNSTPKKGEYVHLIYSDIDKKLSNDRFYIGGVFSSPTRINEELYDSAVSNLDFGSRNKKYQNIKDIKGIQGVYSEPKDITIYGRGTADIVIQDDTVVLRAGKNKTFNSNELPLKNDKRAFLQLTKYDKKTSYKDPEKKYVFRSETNNIKKLIEYDIITMDQNGDSIVGSIYIYNVGQRPGIDANDMSFSKNIESIDKSLLTIINCGVNNQPISIDKFSEIINKTLNLLIDNSSISDLVDDTTNNIQIVGPSNFDSGLMFPMYYRIEQTTYKNLMRNGSTASKISVNLLMSNVLTTPSQENKGYGLVYSKKRENSVPYKPNKETVIPKNTERIDKSVGVIGGDEIYLLSHETQKQGTNSKINLEGTLYRIDENTIADEIEPKTSSMVRGEELLELIGLIVKFLSTHTHSFPGNPPVPISHDGTNVADILKELLIASEKVLNKKIRIN